MYLDQRRFWIWLVWNTENSIRPSWKLHLFIFVEEWAKHSSRQLELGSDGDSVFQLWGDRVSRFCFFTAFVSFLIADKIAEERTSGRKALWAHRYGVSVMSGEAWLGERGGDSCSIYLRPRVCDTLLPVRKWGDNVGASLPSSTFSFLFMYDCIV